ncbi:MAG: ATPase [Lachnospiraceae bacterium]|nr:ATPase [Lachnospiraceae bacterium]
MASKIEQTIDDIFDYLDTCKFAVFNKECIVVNKDDIFDLLEELKSNIPDEVKAARQITANQDAILNTAKTRAAQILSQAEEKQSELIEKNEVMQQAYAQAVQVVNQANDNAREILNQASNEATNYQISAMKYTDDSLAGISDILTKSINDAQSRYNDLISALSECLKIVTNDRAQLAMANDVEQKVAASPQPVNRASSGGSAASGATGSSSGEPQSRPQSIEKAESLRESINDDDIDDI